LCIVGTFACIAPNYVWETKDFEKQKLTMNYCLIVVHQDSNVFRQQWMEFEMSK
jgi:hypothetical protein